MAKRKKPKVFVSHSTLDAAFASKLVNDLNAAGAQAWLDSNELGAGNFQERISQALTDCEWFLLVLTRNALTSEWVRMEVDAAIRLKNQKRIHNLIFIRAAGVDHGELPALWGVFNIFDATQDYLAARDKTFKELGLKVAPTSIKGSQSYDLLDMSVDDLMKIGEALEPVMNLRRRSGSMQHEYHPPCPESVSDRCERRGVDVGRPLSDAGRGRRIAAAVCAA